MSFTEIFESAKKEQNINIKTEEIVLIRCDRITVTKEQGRRYIDSEWLEEVTESIRSQGLDQPICVRPVNDGFELVYGQTRLLAFQKLKKLEIPCLSRPYTEEEAILVAARENLKRKDLSAIDELDIILSVLKIATKLSQEEIINQLTRYVNKRNNYDENHVVLILDAYKNVGKVSVTTFVKKRLPLLDLEPTLLNLARSGKVEFSKIVQLKEVKDKKLRDRLSKLVQKNSLFTVEILSLLKKAAKKNTELAAKLTTALEKQKIDRDILDEFCQAENVKEAIALIEKILRARNKPVLEMIQKKLRIIEDKQAKSLKQDFQSLVKRVRQSNIWQEEAKAKRLSELLGEIEQLL